MKKTGPAIPTIACAALAMCLACALAPAAFAADAQSLTAGTGVDAAAAQTAAKKTVPKPKKVTGVKLESRVMREITVFWNAPKSVEGLTDQTYTVRYSYKKNMKNAKSKTTKWPAIEIGKMKTGKKVYVQVRTNAKFGKRTVHSAWSKVKSVRVDTTHKYRYGLIDKDLLFTSVEEIWAYCDKHKIAARAPGYIEIVEVS